MRSKGHLMHHAWASWRLRLYLLSMRVAAKSGHLRNVVACDAPVPGLLAYRFMKSMGGPSKLHASPLAHCRAEATCAGS